MWFSLSRTYRAPHRDAPSCERNPATVYHSPAAAEATGVRGLPPASFVVAPEDVIVARVRDIDDKVWCMGRLMSG